MRALIENPIFSVGIVFGICTMMILDLWADIELTMAQRFFKASASLSMVDRTDRKVLAKQAIKAYREVILSSVMKTLLLLLTIGYVITTRDVPHWWLVGTFLYFKIWSLTTGYKKYEDELSNHPSAELVEYFTHHLGYDFNESRH